VTDLERLQKNGALSATGSHAHAPQVEEGSRSPRRPFPGCLWLRKIATTDASGNRILESRRGAMSRNDCPLFGSDFRCRSACKAGPIFTCGQRNFLGAAMAFVAFGHRHLWRTYHLPGTQEKPRIFRGLLGSYATHRRQVLCADCFACFSPLIGVRTLYHLLPLVSIR
jgi:hypothetical protein